MEEFRNWFEKSKGFYRYVITANACYEIHIIKHNLDENILEAKANLYLSGDWHDATRGINCFERELLLSNESVKDCITFAVKDSVGQHTDE